ncbi:hypothetical protein B0I72DRAFT_136724 [Yarrowia lipolytica]|jgi:hypothetical protein|uniref:YALI0E18194p n=2 Tax=Yarrowia lipolytica TaxID=4952 RepID=Q6C5G8_YARLI|nr:YALI0E18194p [Yarrowia lipolytica CLIB122]AOW05593.1 hypothetical protein YALI1_E21683g [Yarrowia lipolytica]KAB8282767.1 hypothetical protein BKA91DRAFT_138021 [Yarrowia lipolytica]KAE8173745.1 hypothetical protein BKA90DRAFT_135016 [Yarrowia lipolytica]KAJ8057070.1 hypothetical protein LXG23DRAFT_33949 [Yarrowia lipolytica]QNP99048.1 Hypothetical protein YALI2_E00364g [Yarrowia lipolytica]|eukprot:XP_504094.1 YALI0E18194p [Yarrowia lipolytica CLIB122]
MWSHDFCTVCDKQCPAGSMYCSDACKTSDTAADAGPNYSASSTLYTLRPKNAGVPLSPEELFLDDKESKPDAHHTGNATHHAANATHNATKYSPRVLSQSLPAAAISQQHFGSPPTSDDEDDENYPEYNSHLMYRSPLLCATTRKETTGKKLSPPPSPLMMPSLAYNHQQMGQSVDAAGNYRRWLRS